MNINWSSVGSFFVNAYGGIIKFVKVAAPVAESVGKVIGKPDVVAGAQAAEVVANVADKALEDK